jgi:hypothetical protein
MSVVSVEHWYRQKAQHCLRLAGEASTLRERSALTEEAERWRNIAAAIAKQERSPP